ncbi:hypothetical protein HNY73_010348 [Argiope bruennichi]|uniref:Uncharacterized protein n=1 Tax=Argiope bruennichi TaxID=94029 RepID=A0A8T0F6Q3_ARGBR|nr:hypothetical protein HNY73_010348 [Argiope bruennichi]
MTFTLHLKRPDKSDANARKTPIYNRDEMHSMKISALKRRIKIMRSKFRIGFLPSFGSTLGAHEKVLPADLRENQLKFLLLKVRGGIEKVRGGEKNSSQTPSHFPSTGHATSLNRVFSGGAFTWMLAGTFHRTLLDNEEKTTSGSKQSPATEA